MPRFVSRICGFLHRITLRGFRERCESFTRSVLTIVGESFLDGSLANHGRSKLSTTTDESGAGSDEFAPVTPGEMLREEFLKEYGLSQNGLAAALGISPNRVADIVNNRRRIS